MENKKGESFYKKIRLFCNAARLISYSLSA